MAFDHEQGSSPRRWPALLALTGALSLTAVLVMLAVLPGLPVYHQGARTRWEQQAPRRYQIEVRLNNAWMGGRAVLAVEDERLVAGVALPSGRPLSPRELRAFGDVFPVERMFYRIERLMRWPPTWQGKVARVLPWLRPMLHPCLAPPTIIRYDLRLGYPVEIRERGSPCIAEIGFEASIDSFRPLP